MWWRSVKWIGSMAGLLVMATANIAYAIIWIAARIFSYDIPYGPFALTAAAIILIIWVSLAYGHYIGRFRTEVRSTEYESHEVPGNFDGFRIVHISDLHVDSFEKTEYLQKIIRKINLLDADIILFTGDLTTGSMDEIYRHEDSLKSLKARHGVFSVLGNHDFFIYEPAYHSLSERCQAASRLASYESDVLGWKVLRNQSQLIYESSQSNHPDPQAIAIAGVDNINGGQGFRTIQKGDLNAAIKGLDGIFTILMTHDPSHWKGEVLERSSVQITLSGHTHAAQARIFGWSLARLSFRECDGRYDENGRMLYVNAGIGCTAPFRIACPSEITQITLRHLG